MNSFQLHKQITKLQSSKGTAGTGQTLFLPSVKSSLMMFKKHHIPGYNQEVR